MIDTCITPGLTWPTCNPEVLTPDINVIEVERVSTPLAGSADLTYPAAGCGGRRRVEHGGVVTWRRRAATLAVAMATIAPATVLRREGRRSAPPGGRAPTALLC